MTEAAAVLSIEDLYKSFGALKVTQGVTLDVREDEIHALIGPNGAGKSTLIAQICGEQKSDGGSIRFCGDDIGRLPAHARARAGLGRSFQTTQLCLEFSVLDHVIVALDTVGGGSYNLFVNPRNDRGKREEAMQCLDTIGLGGRAKSDVAGLSHGERRQLEIAVALAR